MEKHLYNLVDAFSKRVVACKRMGHGEAMLENLLYSTPFAYWAMNPPDDCWF